MHISNLVHMFTTANVNITIKETYSIRIEPKVHW